MNPGAVSVLLVVLQLVCLAALAFTGPVIARGIPWLLLQTAGVGLGVWAILSMRLRHLSVFPEPRPDAPIVRHGPYRVIRHPMYTSLLLVSGALVGDMPEVPRIVAAVCLALVLLLKMNREERLLRAASPDYEEYAVLTWRVVPYLF